MGEREVRPNFIYIGAPKSGSTWLYQVLREHPEVYVPPAKEVQFFDKYYEKGNAWYTSVFKDGEGFHAVGDVTPEYFIHPNAAARIHQYNPSCKLIACLRESVEQLISWYHQLQTLGMVMNQPFEVYVADRAIRRRNEYYVNLKPFYDLFPREQILVLFYDDLQQDPRVFCQRVFEFLGVDSGFVPPSVERKIWAAREARSEGFMYVAYQAGRLLRRFGLANLVGEVSMNPWFTALAFKSVKRRVTIAEETEQELREWFARDYDQLARLIGRKLPDSWTAGAPAAADVARP